MKHPLRLLIVNEHDLHRDGSGWRSESWQEFANQIGQYFVRATLWAPVAAGGGEDYDRWALEHLTIEPAPFQASFVGYARALLGPKGPSIVGTTARLVREHDIVLMRIPSPGFPLVALLCRYHRVPLVAAVTGDVVRSNRYAQSRRRLVRWIGLGLGHLVRLGEKVSMSIAADLAIVYSDETRRPYARYARRTWLTREGSISRHQRVYRRTACRRAPYRILQVAYYHRNKNHAMLLRAAATLLARGVDIEVHLAGAPTEPDVARLIAAAKDDPVLAGRIHEHGLLKKRDLYALYEASDILTLTSFSEGWPRVLLEAASFGLPVVTTAVGGIPDFIEHEQNGLLVPSDDHIALADAIERVIMDAALRERLIAKGYESAEQDCLENVVVRWVGEIIRTARRAERQGGRYDVTSVEDRESS